MRNPTFALVVASSVAASAAAQPCHPRWESRSVNGPVQVLYADSVDGPKLFVGGEFTQPVPYLATLDAAGFTPVGAGLGGDVLGIARHDDGTGPSLYVTGFVDVDRPNGWTANYARLEQGVFRFFGDNNGPNSWAGHLASFDLGSGSKLMTTGGFGFPCSYVTMWNGAAWECMDQGLTSTVRESVIYDDGSGPALYCVGGFTVVGLPFQESLGLARWDGVRFSTVGGGLGGGAPFAVTIFDHGDGPELVIGGAFRRAGGGNTQNIASWNGARWRTLGAGLNREISALEAFDDGSGLKLYAAGQFTASGALPAQRLARWDGSEWSACPAGGFASGEINDMLAFDADGPGPQAARLYVAGAFSAVADGTIPASNLAVLIPSRRISDFNADGLIDFFDYDTFVAAFESGDPRADVNEDRFIDFFDYDAFVQAFEAGC